MIIYIDESGSMTHETEIKQQKYFIITLILTEQQEKLKRVYKRFIQKYFKVLKSIDQDNKMFDGDKFKELKGSAFTPDMKKNFVNYFCKNNYFKILYIKIDNSKANENFYKNKARAFNYVIKLALEYLNDSGEIANRIWALNIDERNVKTGTKFELREFLETELSTGRNIVDEISVEYFDSCNNRLIQLADVFSNIFYSNILTNGKYNNEIQYMSENGYLINIFKFPLR